MIRVITHNGLPRSQGGKFLGYLFPRLDGTTGVVPASLAPLFQPPKPPVETVRPLALSAYASSDGYYDRGEANNQNAPSRRWFGM
jgi:hypothetical protein